MARPSRFVRPAPSLLDDEDEEAPLDPAVERVRQRLKRLMLISLATLVLGFAAVAAAVLYKVGPVRDKGVLDMRAGEITAEGALPAGARIVSTALDGRMLAVTFDKDGSATTVVVDLDNGRILRRIVLGPSTETAP